MKVDVVGALEVVVHRNLLFRVGLAILQLEDGILGMGTLIVICRTGVPSELLDRIGLVVCNTCQRNWYNSSEI